MYPIAEPISSSPFNRPPNPDWSFGRAFIEATPVLMGF